MPTLTVIDDRGYPISRTISDEEARALGIIEPAPNTFDPTRIRHASAETSGVRSTDPNDYPQHAEAMARGADCMHCPLLDCRRGPVPSSVTIDAPMSIIGEAPGKDEVLNGENFIGWSGEVLDNALIMGGVVRGRQTIINTIACQPPPPFSMEDYLAREEKRAKRSGVAFRSPIEACRGRLERDLDESNAQTHLAIGKYALAEAERYLKSRGLLAPEADGLVISRVHGAPISLKPRDDGRARFLFASYHPAFAAPDRSPKWMKYIQMNIRRAAEVTRRGFIDWTLPDFILTPPLSYAIEWLRWVRANQYEITIDLETCVGKSTDTLVLGDPSPDPYECAIRTIGFGVTFTGPDGAKIESVMVVPLRHMDGRLWEYTDEDLAQFVTEARLTIDACPIAGHNAYPFDSEIMLRFDAIVNSKGENVGALMSVRNRLITDSMLLDHCTPAQDMPRNLSFMARARFEVPAWKSKEDLTSKDNADDDRLIYRCAVDVLTTMRCLEPLRIELTQADTIAQYKTDEVCGRIERDAASLGLCVDEKVRGFWSRVLGEESQKLLKKWYELVGKEVNPQSSNQMRELLFHDWDCDPPLNTDGKEWDPERDDDDGDEATGVAAIMEILEHGGLSERQKEALETCLEAKALLKPKSTYVDNLPVRKWWGMGDDNQPLGRVSAEGALGDRDAISLIRANASMGKTPVGRSAWKSPGEQQRPKQGRVLILGYEEDGTPKKIKVNMRKMIRAAPGHIFVGADYRQSHVRIYAAVSGDELLYDVILRRKDPRDGVTAMDVHAFNMATLLGKTAEEVAERYDWITHRCSPAEKDYWRFVPKIYCIAEGSLVLTDKGLVPIEKVTRAHKVWDGVEWVTHDGVVFKGLKETIEYDGLRATPDHKVWTTDGRKRRLIDAARGGYRLARTGNGRDPIPFVDHDIGGVESQRSAQSTRSVQMRNAKDRVSRQPNVREIATVSRMRKVQGCTRMDKKAYCGRKKEMRYTYRFSMEGLRRSGNQVQLRISRGSVPVHGSGTRFAGSIATTRSNKQRWALRTWKRTMGDEARKYEQSKTLPEESKVNVYDIVNAGPRRRFTVSNVIVHNCFSLIYGAVAKTIYKTMKAMRRKDNGKRAFPNLTLEDCERWFELWHKNHPWTKPWQQREVALYNARGYAMSDCLDNRKRYAPLEENQIPNHAILAEEGSRKNRALQIIDSAIPHRGFSDHSGFIFECHDSMVVQVPDEKRYIDYATEVVREAMKGEKNGMLFEGDVKSFRTMADL